MLYPALFVSSSTSPVQSFSHQGGKVRQRLSRGRRLLDRVEDLRNVSFCGKKFFSLFFDVRSHDGGIVFGMKLNAP